MPEKGNRAGIVLCEALGIDPAMVRRIVIDAETNAILRVKVELAPKFTDEQLRHIAEKLIDGKQSIAVYLEQNDEGDSGESYRPARTGHGRYGRLPAGGRAAAD